MSANAVDKCHLTDLLTIAQEKMTTETEEQRQVQQTNTNQQKENENHDDNQELIKNIHRTSYGETLMHFLRGMLGTGIWAMGDAYKHGGLILSPFVLGGIALLCLYCQHELLWAANLLEAGGHGKLDFSHTVEAAVAASTFIHVRKFASTARNLVDLFLCITQLGFNCIHFVFISNNLTQVLNEWISSSETSFRLDVHITMLIVLIPVVATCCVRHLKHLAPLSSIANVLMLGSLVLTAYYVVQDLPSVSERPAVSRELSNYPLLFGTALYGFEGIALVLPLQREMKKGEQFGKFFGPLNIGTFIVMAVLIILGFLAYLKYGENVSGSVTMNLPPGEWPSQLARICVSIAILFTYALQLYIPLRIMWKKARRSFPHITEKYPLASELTLRMMLVLLAFTLAESVPYLGLFISLVGAASSASLALIFPPIVCLCMINYSPCPEKTEKKSTLLKSWLIFKNVLILMFGTLGCVTGTYQSISDIVKVFKNNNL